MSSEFLLTLDANGNVSFGLSILKNRKVGILLTSGSEVIVELQPGDDFAVFFPQLGGNYLVSPVTIPSYTATPEDVDSVLNIAHISLIGWPQPGSVKNLFIKSLNDMNMTILFGSVK